MVEDLLFVATVDERIKIPDLVITNLVRQIAEQFSPLKIILFGSYAYGNPGPESDVDLLIVMDTTLPESEQALQIRKSVKIMFGLDLLVYKPERLAQRLAWGDSFLQEIVSKGKVLYESPDA